MEEQSSIGWGLCQAKPTVRWGLHNWTLTLRLGCAHRNTSLDANLPNETTDPGLPRAGDMYRIGFQAWEAAELLRCSQLEYVVEISWWACRSDRIAHVELWHMDPTQSGAVTPELEIPLTRTPLLYRLCTLYDHNRNRECNPSLSMPLFITHTYMHPHRPRSSSLSRCPNPNSTAEMAVTSVHSSPTAQVAAENSQLQLQLVPTAEFRSWEGLPP
jgi:hypothetical protein